MRFVFLLILFIPSILWSQHSTRRSRTELGLMYGGTYYIGDLNQYGHFKDTRPAFGLLYRFNVHSRLALRGNILIGSLTGADSTSNFDLHKNRNLHFRTHLWEAAGGLEFNYFPFEIGHARYKGTAYLLVEMGAFNMNPQAEYNGEWHDLQALGTEGQGSRLTGDRRYSKTQFTMPIGLGFRVTLGDVATLNVEYGIRKTFTDYIDDVGGDMYLPYADLAQANGTLAANLSNRSLDQNRNGRRGNSTTSDWYAFAGAMLTFRLGPPRKCFFEPY